MSDPVIAQKSPYPVEVVEEKSTFGVLAAKALVNPFAMDLTRGTDFLPQTYTASANRTLYFCGCKHTKGAPLCDGAHNAL